MACQRSGRAARHARTGFLAVGAAWLTVFAAGISLPSTPAGAVTIPSWEVTTAPTPGNADANSFSGLDATSCAAVGSCVAVGEYTAGGNGQLLADSLVAGTWSSVQLPAPPNLMPGSEPYFVALSCPAIAWCAAVGGFTDASNHDQGFAAVDSAGSWSVSELPIPPSEANPDVRMQSHGLACPAVGTCIATGSFFDATTNGSTFIDTLTGSTWSTLEAPVPPNAAANPNAELFAAACSSPGNCLATGPYRTATTEENFFDVLSGGTWTPVQTPVPPNADASPVTELFGVACPTGGGCVAVGDYFVNGHDQNLVVTQAGGSFTPTEVAQPSGAAATSSALFNDVSCPVAGSCLAVGSYGVNPTFLPEVSALTGGTWTTQLAPGTPSGINGDLSSVSCSWPGSCAASGEVHTGSNPTSLIDTLVGGSWSGNDTVFPTDNNPSASSFINAPSCTGGTCIVGGSYSTASAGAGMIDSFPNLTGYQEVASDGGLFAFNTPFYGSMGGMHLNAPIVGMAVKPDDGGYYEVASDGGLFAFHAPFQGSMGGKPLNKPIVGIAFDTLTGGYYEVASDGGLFAFNAPFYGSMGGKPLNKPIVGIAFDPMTGGYYEVASDGGIFAFNAPFSGSMGGKPLNQPIVGITFDPVTGGYYEVAFDGGLFAFHAPFQGSMGGKPLNKPIVGMAFDNVTAGYYEVASDGGLFAFNAPFQGSMGGKPLNQPVVGMAFG